MEVGRGVLCRIVLGVREDGRIIVCVMVGGRDVNSMGVGRVHREVRIFARRMEEGRDAPGVIQGRSLVKMMVRATLLPEGKRAFVRLIVLWFKISVFMGVLLWDL